MSILLKDKALRKESKEGETEVVTENGTNRPYWSTRNRGAEGLFWVTTVMESETLQHFRAEKELRVPDFTFTNFNIIYKSPKPLDKFIGALKWLKEITSSK